MRRFISIISALAVMLHATFGCCIHHSHARELDSSDASVAIASRCGCDAHHHGPAKSQSKEDTTSDLDKSDVAKQGHHPRQDDEHECEGESCSFPNVAKSSELEIANVQNLVAAFDIPSNGSPDASNRLYRGHRPERVGVWRCRRLHLLHDVFLI